MKFILALAALAGCYLKQYPVTPQVEDESTYHVTFHTEDGDYEGTAWVAAPGWVVTAGHVCDGADRLVLRSSTGMNVTARPVEWEVGNLTHDACVARVDGPLGRPLILAAEEPAMATPDFVVAFPMGVHGTSRGTYLGNNMSSSYAAPGSSGGALATAKGVYAVLTGARENGGPICMGTPISEVKALLRDVGANFTVTPDDPSDDPWVDVTPGMGD